MPSRDWAAAWTAPRGGATAPWAISTTASIVPGGTSAPPAARDRQGGLGDSALTVPDWINEVHELFPKRTIERLERDALERYHLTELVTNPELLARAQPSAALLKAVLHTRHLMNQEVLALARQLVRKVIEQLAALDERADPSYDRSLGEQMAALCCHVGAMTPGELAEWVAKKVR
jgi:hypothetical protein